MEKNENKFGEHKERKEHMDKSSLISQCHLSILSYSTQMLFNSFFYAYFSCNL